MDEDLLKKDGNNNADNVPEDLSNRKVIETLIMQHHFTGVDAVFLRYR